MITLYNIIHLKYAVEVAKTGSISRAAENLYIGQPQLSKAIKELENSLDITIFNRNPKGVTATPKGEEFLMYARNILSQIEEMKSLSEKYAEKTKVLSITVPRASYISDTLTKFLLIFGNDRDFKLDYMESNASHGIENVINSVNNFAIIRYPANFEKYFLNTFLEKEIKHEVLWKFSKCIIMSEKHPCASKDIIDYNDMIDFPEISHGDLSIPNLPIAETKKLIDDSHSNLFIYERGSQFEILSKLTTSFMLVAPVPEETLKTYNLVQKQCIMSKNKYKDVIISRKNHKFSSEELQFIELLKENISKLTLQIQ